MSESVTLDDLRVGRFGVFGRPVTLDDLILVLEGLGAEVVEVSSEELAASGKVLLVATAPGSYLVLSLPGGK